MAVSGGPLRQGSGFYKQQNLKAAMFCRGISSIKKKLLTIITRYSIFIKYSQEIALNKKHVLFFRFRKTLLIALYQAGKVQPTP